MITGSYLPTHLSIDPSLHQAADERWTEQEMVEPQTGVPAPAIALVVPKRVHRLPGMKRADRVGPALVQKTLKSGPTLWL